MDDSAFLLSSQEQLSSTVEFSFSQEFNNTSDMTEYDFLNSIPSSQSSFTKDFLNVIMPNEAMNPTVNQTVKLMHQYTELLTADIVVVPSAQDVDVTGFIDIPHGAIPAITATQDYRGAYVFSPVIEPGDEKSRKIQYNHEKRVLYVDSNNPVRLKFKTRVAPMGSRIVVTCIYTEATSENAPVMACREHREDSDNLAGKALFKITQAGKVVPYEVDDALGHISAICYPTQSYLLSFNCRLTCTAENGPNRRPVKMIFRLFDHDSLIGQHSINVKVAACPDRDFKRDFPEESGAKKRVPKIYIPDAGSRTQVAKRPANQEPSGDNKFVKIQDRKMKKEATGTASVDVVGLVDNLAAKINERFEPRLEVIANQFRAAVQESYSLTTQEVLLEELQNNGSGLADIIRDSATNHMV